MKDIGLIDLKVGKEMEELKRGLLNFKYCDLWKETKTYG